jgi:hypothetical protein
MKYNPKNELSEEQLKVLSEDEFFEYLDSKAAYLAQHTSPLSSYHTKRFAHLGAAISNSDKGTDEIYKNVDYDVVKKIAQKNEQDGFKKLIDKKYKNK